MKAWHIGSPPSLDSLSIKEGQRPDASPGRVVVRWRAASLNFHDLLVIEGILPAAAERVPMSDGAGEIVAVGAGVLDWSVGDRVISLFFPRWHDGMASGVAAATMTGDSIDGCGMDYGEVGPDELTRMPERFSFEQAATLPCAGLTAWRAIAAECRVKPGDSVLVEGTGGMSIFCLQFAKAAGATVYATSSSDEKLQRLKELGADHVLNYRTNPNWGATISTLSGGIDHVIDSGGASTLEQSMLAARIGGTVILVGVLGGISAQINLGLAFAKQLRLQAIGVGNRRMQLDMVRAIEANRIEPVIDKVFGFDDLPNAFRYLKSGKHFGKVLIRHGALSGQAANYLDRTFLRWGPPLDPTSRDRAQSEGASKSPPWLFPATLTKSAIALPSNGGEFVIPKFRKVTKHPGTSDFVSPTWIRPQPLPQQETLPVRRTRNVAECGEIRRASKGHGMLSHSPSPSYAHDTHRSPLLRAPFDRVRKAPPKRVRSALQEFAEVAQHCRG